VSDLAGKHVLVTGGAGFIGSAIASRLLERGAEVTVADLKPSEDPRVESVVGDLREAANVTAAVQPGMHAVLHLAALTSVLKSVDAPTDFHTTNVDATAALLERARSVGVPSFVAASTNAVVGDVGRERITEDLPLRPLTPYGATKAAAEMLMSAYSACYDMACCPLRLSNVYGPGMGLKDSMVPRLMRAALTDTTVQIYGDGQQVRDFVHVSDVTDAFLLAMSAGWSGPTIIGAGESFSVLELLEFARRVTGSELPAHHVAAKPGEMPAVLVDPARAQSLGWKAEVSIRDGLETAWTFFRDLHAADATGAGG
jgi:UDP-glucose 4-epimerase